MTGTEMKEALIRLGWSQAELARRIGYTEKTVSLWVNGGEVPLVVERYLRLKLQLDES